MCAGRKVPEPGDRWCSAERTRTWVRSIGKTRMKPSYTRWMTALATLASLACLSSAASAAPKRAAHPMAVTAARNATAAHPSHPALHAALVRHRGHHVRHLRSTTLTVRRAVGSTRPVRLPAAPKSHRAAAIPTIAHRAPTSRNARGNAQSACALPGQSPMVGLEVRDLRASECLVPMIATDPVWSGRGPPRAGPHSDQPRPQRPAPSGSLADAHPSASACTTNPRLTSSIAVLTAASGCRFACRPEGTAASLVMPSSGVEHVS